MLRENYIKYGRMVMKPATEVEATGMVTVYEIQHELDQYQLENSRFLQKGMEELCYIAMLGDQRRFVNFSINVLFNDL